MDLCSNGGRPGRERRGGVLLGHEVAAVELRPLTRGDRDLVASFFAGLSPRTLYQRFCAPKPRLTAADLDTLSDLDGDRHVAIAAFGADGDPIAIGRYLRVAGTDDIGEVALTVADAWQNRGLGSRLTRALAQSAVQAGITRFHATVLSDNKPALAVLRKLGRPASVSFEGAALDLEVPLD